MTHPTPWTCPACDRQFGRTNQSHTCAPAMSVDTYFAAQPEAYRRVYDAVAAHLQTLGPIIIDAVNVGILIKRSRTFAELRPMRGRIRLSLLLSRTAEDPRIVRVLGTSGARRAHFIDLRDAADVDAAVRDLLTESYVASPA